MAFKCGFFNAKNGDRKYNADDMMNPIKGIVSDGIVADDAYSDGLQVQAYEGLEVVVKKGYGKFHNKWCELDADMIITVPTPHVTETRIDSIVIKIDTSDSIRNGFLEYRQGTTVAPELERNDSVMEYRLANITVAPNVTEITQADIEDTRPTSECGFVTNLLQNSDITATYAQWKSQFDEWYESNDAAFKTWFENLKSTLSTVTLISSYSSRYVTTEQDETVIPINIARYNSVVDILQVYINGLLLVKDFDYTVNGFDFITLTNGVDAGTQISFVVYKSIDGTGAETIAEEVEYLREDFGELQADVNELQSKVTVLESKTDEALWTGANTMGDGATIIPSKKLSECKNGWLLVWSDYDDATAAGVNAEFVTTYIPKNLQKDFGINAGLHLFPIPTAIVTNGSYTMTVKRVSATDDTIYGNVANTATDAGKDTALRAVYEY